MQCLTPITIRNPAKAPLTRFIEVPCGKCLICLRNKQADWVFRLTEELKVAKSAFFVTLTYDDHNLPWIDDGPCFDKSDIQKFFKRLRKEFPHENLRYFLCAEYGGNFGRPHYHCILFNFPFKVADIHEKIHKHWKQGLIHVGEVTPASIMYVTKYCLAPSAKEFTKERKPFILTSRRPALGSSYLSDSNVRYHHDSLTTYRHNESGFAMRIPRLLRDKIFTDEIEKAKLSGKSKKHADEQRKKINKKYGDNYPKVHFDRVTDNRRILLKNAKDVTQCQE